MKDDAADAFRDSHVDEVAGACSRSNVAGLLPSSHDTQGAPRWTCRVQMYGKAGIALVGLANPNPIQIPLLMKSVAGEVLCHGV